MDDLVFRLKERARIRRQISSRKSVQEGKPDRISDLLEEAAAELEMFHIFREKAFEVYPNIDLDLQIGSPYDVL